MVMLKVMETSQEDVKEKLDKSRPRSESNEAGSETGSDTAKPAPSSDGSSTQKKKRRRSSTEDSGSTLQERWDELYERLRRYKEAKGNCNVPNRYPEDPQLGFWVSTQRRQYRVLTSGGSTSSALTVQRAQKLMNLGFEWSAKDPRMVPWETRFSQLKEFVAKNGHAQVPIGWEENVPLSNWVSKQRQEYKLLQKGKASRLTEDRIEKLKQIGFVWEAKRGAPRQVIVSGDRQTSTSTSAGSPVQRQDSASSRSPAAQPDQRSVPAVTRAPEGDYVVPPPPPAAAAAGAVGGGAASGANTTTVTTPPTSHRPIRGMGPASPRSSASAPAPLPPGLPTARLPPSVHPSSYHVGAEATYHGVFQPRPQHEYYAHHPSHSYYPSAFSSPYPHAIPSASSFRPPHHDHYTPSGPPPPLQPPATWPRTGRVLTPLYPLEQPPIPGYLVATPPGRQDAERRPPHAPPPHAGLSASAETQDNLRRRSTSAGEGRGEHASPPQPPPPPPHTNPPPAPSHPSHPHHDDGRGGYY